MTVSRHQVLIAAVMASLNSVPASAHLGTGLPGGVTSGFIHPLTGVDHLLAMVSVGIWGAFLGRPLLFALPILFPAVMVCGALLGMFEVVLPVVEVGIALSVLVLGLCILTGLRAPVWLAVAIVAPFAIFHGYAHGRELPSAADPIGYSIGFVCATGLLHVGGICIGCLGEWRQGVLCIRGAGALIAGLGAWFLFKASGI